MSDVKQGLSNEGKDVTDGNANTEASNKPQVNSLWDPLMSLSCSVSCHHAIISYMNEYINNMYMHLVYAIACEVNTVNPSHIELQR